MLTTTLLTKIEKAQPVERARLLNVWTMDRLDEMQDQEKYFLYMYRV